jgi:GDP-4-dehydro-6-deoxy-D-mannose reductase
MGSGYSRPLQIWITGAGGFLGQHLKRSLSLRGDEVFGDHVDLSDTVRLREVARSKPWDIVVHLAGIGSVAQCDQDPARARAVNVEGTRTLARILSEHCPRATLIFASTAQVYQGAEGAELQAGVTFDESRRIAPQNLYAQTKWEAEEALRSLAAEDSSKLKTIILRLFNFTHKTQPPVAFVPHLYSVLKSRAREVPVGNLHVERDIGALPDFLSAALAIIDSREGLPALEPINVCSGVPKLLNDLASRLAMRMKSDAKFVVDEKRVRPNEALRIAGSHRRLTELTGWTPRFRAIEELLDAFLMDDFVDLVVRADQRS